MKKTNKIIAFVAVFCMICVSVSAANLTTEVERTGNEVTVKYFLDGIPSDIEEISSITIKLNDSENILTYVSIEASLDKLGRNLQAAKNIAWMSMEPLTAEELEAVDGLLYTVNYLSKDGLTGTKEVGFDRVLFTDNDANKSADVNYDSIVIDFGEDDNTGSDNTGSDNTGSDNTGSDNTGSDNTGSDNTGSGNTGSGNTGSGNTGSDNTGSGNTGSDNTGSDNTGSDNTGSDNTGSGNTGNGNTGTGNTPGRPSGGTIGGGTGGSTGGNVGGSGAVVAPKPETIPNFKGFSDIPEDDWGYKYAYSLMAKGIVSGDGGEMPSMRPNDLITRQEAAKLALLAKGIQLEEGLTLDFADKDKIASWAYPYIATAVKHGLINGFEDGTVGAEKFITREQMLTILGRAMGWNITEGKSVSFADANDISEWSKDSIAYAVENGIMNGYDDNTVRPKANITRIETFALVDRCISGK